MSIQQLFIAVGKSTLVQALLVDARFAWQRFAWQKRVLMIILFAVACSPLVSAQSPSRQRQSQTMDRQLDQIMSSWHKPLASKKQIPPQPIKNNFYKSDFAQPQFNRSPPPANSQARPHSTDEIIFTNPFASAHPPVSASGSESESGIEIENKTVYDHQFPPTLGGTSSFSEPQPDLPANPYPLALNGSRRPEPKSPAENPPAPPEQIRAGQPASRFPNQNERNPNSKTIRNKFFDAAAGSLPRPDPAADVERKSTPPTDISKFQTSTTGAPMQTSPILEGDFGKALDSAMKLDPTIAKTPPKKTSSINPNLRVATPVEPTESETDPRFFSDERSENDRPSMMPIVPFRTPAKKASTEKSGAEPVAQDHVPAPAPAGTTLFKLAGEPQLGDHFGSDIPETGPGTHLLPFNPGDFPADPIDDYGLYDPGAAMNVYDGKTLWANQRPLLELGRPWYQLGQLRPGYTFLGSKNLVTPQFIVFGDLRTAYSSATQFDDNRNLASFELNLFFDMKITSTERILFAMSPLDRGLANSKFLLDDGWSFDNQLNPNVNFGFFEGDMGALVGGLVNQNLPFDLPFSIGVMPLLFQNGIWMEDAILGAAVTLPARNSALLDISNFDLTFFFGWDRVTSPAFAGDDNGSKIYGIASFIDAWGGYFEIDYAFLEDRDSVRDRSYHNVGFGFSRTYGRFVANSLRVISNIGQSTESGPNTADGLLLLSENVFITSEPSTFIPYINFFAGFDRPQSAARDIRAGGILRNTGILFESDGMTNFPTLEDTANDTYGAAVGFNILARDFSQQLILEAATVQVHGADATRRARGDQYGLGVRYQLPVTNADIIRFDGMIGFFENADNVNGIRVEWRHKW